MEKYNRHLFLKQFFSELKDHLKDCYSNDGFCYWKTPLLTCECNCSFCKFFKLKFEFLNISDMTTKEKRWSELRCKILTNNYTKEKIATTEVRHKNYNQNCWTYRFKNKREVENFANKCQAMKVEIIWQKS